ncbi:MAG: hypothetical protein IJM68_11885 [Synergistaceae bacterium]|nr:hypothetical protein [Synergistaceae bacterium]
MKMSRYKKFAALIVIALCVIPTCSFAADELGLERVRLGIMRFDSKTYDVPDRMAAAITDIFGRVLFKSKGIMLVEREKLEDVMKELRLGMSGLVDEDTAAEVGKLAGCDYMLMGSITNLARASSGVAIPLFVVPVSVGSKNQKVKATLDVRLVKVETGEVVFAETADGNASKSDTALSAYGVGVENSEFGGIEGTAVANAVMSLAPKIEKELTGTDTLSRILEADKKPKGKKAKSKGKSDKSDEQVGGSSATVNRPKKGSKKKATEASDEVLVASAPQNDEGTVSASSRQVNSAAFENDSTDFDTVISSYGLSKSDEDDLKAKHRKLSKMGNTAAAYREYSKLFDETGNDYFAAYKAGEVARALKKKSNAKMWYNKALEINPNYAPAKKALSKL